MTSLTEACEVAGAEPPAPLDDSTFDLRTALPPALLDGIPTSALEHMTACRTLRLAMASATGEWRVLLHGGADA